MNIIGILVVTLAINTWGKAYYGLGTFPAWAAVGNTTDRCAKYNGVSGNTTVLWCMTVSDLWERQNEESTKWTVPPVYDCVNVRKVRNRYQRIKNEESQFGEVFAFSGI